MRLRVRKGSNKHWLDLESGLFETESVTITLDNWCDLNANGRKCSIT